MNQVNHIKTLFRRNTFLHVLLLLLFLLPAGARAQTTYPVQVYTQLIPPYSPYIPSYYTGTVQKLRVMLINTDTQQPLVRVYLRMKILSSSFSLTTPPEVYTPQIELQAGVPLQLSLNDLEVYFKRENMRVSGGQSEFYRTQMLPDNFYRFHFEVYEVGTNRLVSNPNMGFAQAMIAAGEPPVLNLPVKGAVIKDSPIPNIMFSWTPRHTNSVAAAYNTEYDISLVEIYDKQAAPEAAFDYSRVLYTETTRSTSFTHTVAQPLLLPGMRYAWRVQARAREGVDEVSVFKNNGYSPVYWFDYAADCKTVQMLGAVYEDEHVNITWQDVGASEYLVEYRKKGTARWFAAPVSSPGLSPVYSLQFGQEYEYRIGTRCTANDSFAYSETKAFAMPDRQESGPNCGLLPDVNLTNQTPARELQSLMPVLVGDFPVFITKVSGSGRFSGEGYVSIPYLKGAQIAVTFKDIVVNTDNRLIAGFFETKYDEENNNLLLDGDEYMTGGKGVGDIRTGEEKAQFIVDYTIDPNVKAKPVKADGTTDNIAESGDYTLAKGENGKYTFVLTDSEGNEQKVETDTIPVTIEDKAGNTYEVNEKGEVTTLSKTSDMQLDPATMNKQSGIAVLSFRANKNTKYALDEYDKVYEKVTEYNYQYTLNGSSMPASAKFMLPGTSDEVEVYISENIENRLLPDRVRFVTGDGKEYESRYDAQTRTWTLTVVAGNVNDGQEVYAVQDMGGNKTETLGKLDIYTYEPLERKVTLVPVNGAMNGLTKESVEQSLNEIYSKIGITWTVNVQETPFSFTPKDEQTFNVTGSGLLSMFTDDMKAINEAFKASGEYQEDGLYLFVLPYQPSEGGTNGDMPLDSQFGYLFAGADDRTIAHEAGHGAFNLEHPFDRPGRNSFEKGMLVNNLMDYVDGTGFAKIQWDATRAPGKVFGLFQTDKSGMISKYLTKQLCVDSTIDKALRKNGYVLAANNQYFKLSDNASILQIAYDDTSNNPANQGAVTLFKENDKIYTATYRISTGEFISYKEGDIEGLDYEGIKYLSSIQGGYYKVEISKADCTVTIDGKVYQLTENLCDCGKPYKTEYAQNFADNYKDVTDEDMQKQIAKIATLLDDMDPDYIKELKEKIDSENSGDLDDPTSLGYYFKPLFRAYDRMSGLDAQKLASTYERIKKYNTACIDLARRANASEADKFTSSDQIIELVKGLRFGEIASVSQTSFEKLTIEQRKYLIDIFVKSNDLSSRILGSSDLDSGDIAALVIITASDADIYSLVSYLGDKKLMNILQQMDNVPGLGNFAHVVTAISNAYLKKDFESSTNKESLDSDIVRNGKMIEFDAAFFGKKNTENLDGEQVCFTISEDPIWKTALKSAIPVAGPLYAYLSNTSPKTCYSPLEYVWVIPSIECEYAGYKFEIGQVYRMPAIMAYLVFQQETIDHAITTGRIALESSLMFVGAGELGLALRAGVTFRSALLVSDVAIGEASVIINNIPEMDQEDTKEIKEYFNYATIVYTLSRIGYAGYQNVKVKWPRGVNIAGSGKYTINAISQETGFVDLLPNILQKEGLTMDDFRYMMQKNVNALTDAEKTTLANIRSTLPKPDANTIMQKVITKSDIEKYLNGEYSQVGGFVTKASDAKHLKSYEDLYFGERLDYINGEGKQVFFVEDGSCGVIRFTSDKSNTVIIPKGGTFDNYDYPFTSTGFTSGNNGRLGVPEWTLPNRVEFKDGTELWEIFNDGTERIRAIYNLKEKKFIIIK